MDQNFSNPSEMQNQQMLHEKLKPYFQTIDALAAEVEKVVIGKHRIVMLLIASLLSGGHILIEDVPGVGKTTLAATLARAAGLSFKRAQFTPDVMASDITGFNLYNRRTEQFEFREGLVMCHILLADEINRASPKTQSALLEAMEESRVTVDGETYDIPDPFMVIATQNPTGFVGTYPLPEAQLDRFALKLTMGYPTFDEEMSILQNRKSSHPVDSVNPVTDVKTIQMLRQLASSVYIDEAIYKYIVLLVSSTRRHPSLALGASPRAALALMRMAQVWAFLHRRTYVLPDDVASVYHQTIAHRLILTQEAKLDRVTPEAVLTELIHKVAVPYKSDAKADAQPKG